MFASLCLLLVGLAASCHARSAYQLPAGAEDIVPDIKTTFDCAGRQYGYYADVDNDCKIFHVCQPIAGFNDEIVETAQFSFLCGLGTIFSQETLTCVHPGAAFPCEDAATLYDAVNSEFGRIDE